MTIIGKLAREECDYVYKAFKRKSALKELLMSLRRENDEYDALYEKLVSDYADVSEQLSRWWERYSAENSVKYNPNDQWGVNFETFECYLL